MRQCIIIHSCNFLFSQYIQCPRVSLRLLFRYGRIASRDADKVRSRRYRRNRRADRKAGGGKTSGRSLKAGGGIKRANSTTSASPFSLAASSFFLLSFLPLPRRRRRLPLRVRVTPSGFPLFTFIWIFLAARAALLPLIRREPCANLLHEPSSFLLALSQSPSLFSFYFFIPLMSATIQWF